MENGKYGNRNLDLIEWIKQYDENNRLDEIENNEGVSEKNNNFKKIFYEKFLPDFSERLNISSSNDIYDYEHNFSKPIAQPLIDKEIYKSKKEKIIESNNSIKEINKEQKRKKGRIKNYYSKKNKFQNFVF